ncbi:hypothetical protein MTO96_011885 [Rhipicephalus appendiculatus]
MRSKRGESLVRRSRGARYRCARGGDREGTDSSVTRAVVISEASEYSAPLEPRGDSLEARCAAPRSPAARTEGRLSRSSSAEPWTRRRCAVFLQLTTQEHP